MTYGFNPFDPKANIYGNTHDILTNGLSTTLHSSSYHLHIKLHIPKKHAYLHASGTLMAVLPCLDYL